MSPETALTSRLNEDRNWRIRELSEIVRACGDASDARQHALLRAAVPVIYAHWEGYFVHATNSYLIFLSEKHIRLSALRDEFWSMTIRKRFRPAQLSGESPYNRFLLTIRSEADCTFKKGQYERINGASNLKSDVVRFCFNSIGLDDSVFTSYYDFIDNELLTKRNHIAHGASLRFDASSVTKYRDNVVDLMRITANQIENSVVQRSYLK